MQSVVIISQIQSYLLVSLKEWFEKAEYEVTIVKADVETISQIEAESMGVILLYVDEKMADEQQALNFIKDKAVESDIPVFAIGDTHELSVVESMISRNLIRRKFLRPINVSEVVSAPSQ